MQWLQDPNQSLVEDLNNVRREVVDISRGWGEEYLNDKIDELETMSKIKNIREFYGATMTLRRVTGLELI